jgi:hypothetical protein
MTDHAHCFCFPVGLSETHAGGYELDERGKKKPIVRENNTRDTMCCHCGAFKERKLKFIQTEGHGLLRHHIWHAPKEDAGKK